MKHNKYKFAQLRFYLELNIQSAAGTQIEASICEMGDS